MQPCQPLTLVRELLVALDAEEIHYCHWKSNDLLERSATAENDLDFLVHPLDEQRFQMILAGLGFRLAQAPLDKAMPGVVDFHGHDSDSGKLVHVHAHFRLVVGDDRTKNYRLPLESLFLESTSEHLGFRIPCAEIEFITFVMRMVLKHGSWDAILEGKGTLSEGERSELEHLQSRVDASQLAVLLSKRIPFLEPQLFSSCVKSLESQASVWLRSGTARRLHQVLKPYARRPRTVDLYLKAWRRCAQAIRRRALGREGKYQLGTGGALVAIVGGDGAGKTTAVNALHQWLQQELDTQVMHLGKPAWSWTTYCVRGFFKLGRLFGLCPYVKAEDLLYANGDKPLPFPGYGLLLREVCTSRDRYLAYCRAHRAASQGSLVICDRHPLPGVSMDGPQLPRWTPHSDVNWFLKYLSRLEASYYRAYAAPDVLFVLRVDPEIAVARKTDEEPHYVRARSSEIWNWDSGAIEHFSIDASQPRERVAAELKQLAWSTL